MTTPATSRRHYLFADWQERGRLIRCWYGEGMGWASLWGANTYRESQATAIIRAWAFHETLVKIGRVRPYSLLVRAARPSSGRCRGQYRAAGRKRR